MRRIPGYGALLLLAMAIAVPVAITGCSAHASGSVKGTKVIMPTDTGATHAENNAPQHSGTALAGN